MSHATVLVVGDDVDGQMAPYNENILFTPYKERPGLDPSVYPVSVVAKAVENGESTVDLLDPVAVAAWLNTHYGNDEYGADDYGLFSWSTANPRSKWDWYQVGGRWPGLLLLKQPGAKGALVVDRARKGDIDRDTMRTLRTHAVLAEGIWHEVGRLGWFGQSSDDESDQLAWEDWYQNFLEGLPDQAMLTIVDYHI
jgi:hypothetical protein